MDSLELETNPRLKETGFVTTSSGNHGQGLASICRELAVPCKVFVPHECPDQKRQVIADYGAETVPCHWFSDGVYRCQELEREEGHRFISTSNNLDVIAGD